MDEIIEQYWLMLDAGNEGETMNRNDSELDFQRFLKETDEGTTTVKLCFSPLISSTIVDNNLKINNNIIDSEKEDHQTLKTKLDLECAAFTMTWVCVSFSF